MTKQIQLIGLISVGTLAACGGGGGTSPAAGTTAAAPVALGVPIEAAASAFATQGRSFNALYIDPVSGDQYTLGYGLVPASDALFEGKPVKSDNLTATLKKNGVLINSSTGARYFTLSPFTILGEVANSGYTVLSGFGPLPVTAKVGDSGALYTSTTYTDSSKTAVDSTSSVNFTIEPDSATTVYFCENEVTRFTNLSPNLSSSECFRIDTSGNITGIRFTVGIGGKSAVFIG